MADNTTDQAIRSRIDSFLAELSGLVRKAAMESVQEALGGDGAPPRRRGPGRPRGSGRRGPGRPRKAVRRARRTVARAGKRVRRSAEDLDRIAARVLAHVKSNAGQRLEQIGKALKVQTSILKRPVANLLASKKLRTKGQKRGTMYFAGGGRGGASKPRRKVKAQRRRNVRSTRKAKASRKAKVTRRRPRKKAARRAAPRIVRPAKARRAKTRHKPAIAPKTAKAGAIADAVALQAAVPPGSPL